MSESMDISPREAKYRNKQLRGIAAAAIHRQRQREEWYVEDLGERGTLPKQYLDEGFDELPTEPSPYWDHLEKKAKNGD